MSGSLCAQGVLRATSGTHFFGSGRRACLRARRPRSRVRPGSVGRLLGVGARLVSGAGSRRLVIDLISARPPCRRPLSSSTTRARVWRCTRTVLPGPVSSTAMLVSSLISTRVPNRPKLVMTPAPGCIFSLQRLHVGATLARVAHHEENEQGQDGQHEQWSTDPWRWGAFRRVHGSVTHSTSKGQADAAPEPADPKLTKKKLYNSKTNRSFEHGRLGSPPRGAARLWQSQPGRAECG